MAPPELKLEPWDDTKRCAMCDKVLEGIEAEEPAVIEEADSSVEVCYRCASPEARAEELAALVAELERRASRTPDAPGGGA